MSGSRLITSGNVMKRPPSPGQHFSTGKSERLGVSSTTSLAGPRRTRFGRDRNRRKTVRRFAQSAPSVGGLMRSANVTSSSPICSGCIPNASSIRRSLARRFMASGKFAPSTFSNSIALPPDLTILVAISVISSSGLTGAVTRRSSPSTSRARTNDWRSKKGTFNALKAQTRRVGDRATP